MRPSYTCTSAVHENNCWEDQNMCLYSVICILELGSNLWLVWEMASILSSRYQPSPRVWHYAGQIGRKVYTWGGRTQDFLRGGQDKLKSTVNVFDPFLETWQEQHTTGGPPRGLCYGAAVAHSTSLYSFAGHDGIARHNSLHVLDTDMLLWTDAQVLSTTHSPMPKSGCGMVFFGTHHLATIGGYGVPTLPIQTGSSFFKNPDHTDGSGWTNEFHVFDVTEGKKILLVATSSVILCVGVGPALE